MAKAAAEDKVNGMEQDLNTGAILVCAVRYALGRRTYMPGLVMEWARRHWKAVPSADRITIYRDIGSALNPGGFGLGDPCDAEMWEAFYRWVGTALKPEKPAEPEQPEEPAEPAPELTLDYYFNLSSGGWGLDFDVEGNKVNSAGGSFKRGDYDPAALVEEMARGAVGAIQAFALGYEVSELKCARGETRRANGFVLTAGFYSEGFSWSVCDREGWLLFSGRVQLAEVVGAGALSSAFNAAIRKFLNNFEASK